MALVPFDRGSRALLGALADVWVPVHRLPADAGNSRPRPSQLGVIEFIEALITSPIAARNRSWAARVALLESSPLRLAPHEQPIYWRTSRGLDSLPVFGIKDSENMDLDRAAFYEKLLAVLIPHARKVLEGPGPWPDDKVQQIATDLIENKVPGWPPSDQPKWSVGDFVKDIATALLATRSVGSPRPFELLDALNESRRIGNRYTAQNVTQATRRFKEALDAKMGWGQSGGGHG